MGVPSGGKQSFTGVGAIDAPRNVACLGILVADMVARPVDSLPPPGELRFVDEMGLCIGGCAANTGAGLARLGVPVAVLGKVGDDALGEFLLRALQREGVHTQGVVVDPGVQTSATVALVAATGERAFLHAVGGNGALRAGEVDLHAAGGATILHIGGTGLMPSLDGAPLAEVCAQAKALGLVVTLDTAWDPSGGWRRVLQVLPHVDYFLPSLEEAQHIFGLSDPAAIAAAARNLGPQAVVIKLASEGCYVLAPGRREGLRLPPLPVAAVDTTGAGDAFCAGFLAALSRGWDTVSAARIGTVTGALSVPRLGAIAGVPSWEEACRVLATLPSL